MGSVERRQRERKAMEEAILDAATALFTTHGFEQTTIRRIAEAIEYTPGTIYSYFADKDAILYALHVRGFEAMGEAMAPVAHVADPLERLRAIGKAYLRFGLTNPQLYDLMFISGALGRKIEAGCEGWLPGETNYDALRRTVEVCIETGALPRHDLEAATFACWGLVHGLVSLVLRNRTTMLRTENVPATLDGAFDFMFEAILRHDTAEPG